MRSNTSDNLTTQAVKHPALTNRLTGAAGYYSRKAAGWITLGITGRQWLASLMIGALLSSIFALPVRAAIELNAYQSALASGSNPDNFEPVNEPLPMWKESWLKLNQSIELWLTPKRELNLAFKNADVKDTDDKDTKGNDKPKARKPAAKEMLERRVKTLDIRIEKQKKITVGQTFALAATAEDIDGKSIEKIVPVWTSSNPDILKIDENNQAVALKAGTVSLKAGVGVAEKEISLKIEASANAPKDGAAAKNSSQSAAALKRASMFLQIPESADRPILDNEPTVLVSPGGNLGTPPGQTEAQSNIRGAAVRTKDRAGIGNFSFELPIASLPGRGISASVGLSYNSQLWTRSGTTSSYLYTYNIDGNWMGPGFQIGYGYLDAYTSTTNLPYNLILTSTDGTRHQLDMTSASSGHAVYESSDGSFMKSDATYNTSTNVVTNLTVTYADGTKVLYGGANPQNRRFPTQITDIQGNYITITYLTDDQVGKIASIKDTLGRYINFHYDTTAEQNLISVTVPGYNNSAIERQTIRFYYESLTLQTQNSQSQNRFNGTITAPTSVTVLKYVYYPGTNTGYRYDYSAAYGMIYKITHLEGMQVTGSPSNADTPDAVVTTSGSYLESATTHYDYPRSDVNQSAAALDDVPKYFNRTDDWIGRDTSTAAPNTYYYGTTGTGTRTMTVTSPNGSISASVSIVDPGVCDDGLTKETSVTSSGRTIPWAKTTIEWSPCTGNQNPHVSKIIQTNEVGQMKATTFTYDSYDNPLTVREYDFDPTGQPTTELRRTEATYMTSSDLIANRLVHLPQSVKTIVNNTTVVSRTDYEYDGNALTDRSGIVQHDSTYNSSNTPSNARGNVTKTTTFINPSSAAVNPTDANDSVTTMSYDIAGNPVQATVDCCNLKTWTYDVANYFAYPMSETKGTDVQLTTSATYDFNTGLIRTSTDENNQPTTYDYESDTLRPSKVTYPNYGYVQTEYSDKLVTTTAQLSPGFVRQTTLLDTNKTVQSYNYYDGHGASIRNATQTPDGWNISATVYDAIGRAKKSYNPFYGATPTAAVPSTVKGTEVTVYDGLDRATEVKLQDDTLVNTYYNEAVVTDTPPLSRPTRQGTATRVKDQAGKDRRQIVDALGRVIRVDEPDVVNSSLGTAGTPNQPTYYWYDGNDNLSDIIQSDGTNIQERGFNYDALSRMTAERQIEAAPVLDLNGTVGAPDPVTKWTKVLKYNAHGDITDGYDARGVHTHFVYDGLNRISTVTYSDGTPQITYTYDQARTGYYNKGALTKTETAQGDYSRPDTPYTTVEFDYDKMGRVREQRQVIGTQAYYLDYVYNLAGQLTSETYPSGKVVTTNYDAGGRMAGINDASRTYLSNLQYQGKGNSLSSMNLGNGTAQTITLNDRLQMTSQSLIRGADVLQKYDYGYGKIDGSGNLDTTKNNGQLAKIDSTIGTTTQWTQKFSYDAIGRLSDASEYRGDNGSLSYKQKFDYDRFGNLYRKNASNPTTGQASPLLYTPIEDADISKTTNRFTSGTTYDNAGNVTQDTKFRSLNFSYDANGRVYKTSNTSNTNQANSVYDASGNRVATQVDGVWTFFVYDIGGKLVSEYGGLAAMDEGGVKYVLQDWQGSSRAILSNSGFVQARMDYTAFGEEIGSGVGQRTTAQGFAATNNFSQKYSSTERDKATGLDHTWFRKNENRAGRWTSPDPYDDSMIVGAPQSFNRYSYVVNDPINFVDPLGLCLFKINLTISKVNSPNSRYTNTTVIQTAQNEITRIFNQAGHQVTFDSSANADGTYSMNIREGWNGDAYASGNRGQGAGSLWTGELAVEAFRPGGALGYTNEGVGLAIGRITSHEAVTHNFLGYSNAGHTPSGLTRAVFGTELFRSDANSANSFLIPEEQARLLDWVCKPPPVDEIGQGGGGIVEGGGIAPVYYTSGGMSDADWAFFTLDMLMSYHYETSVRVLD